MEEKETLFVSVNDYLFKIDKCMNFIKNILFVSYLKNKGVCRICLAVGLLLCLYQTYSITTNIMNVPTINETYKNLSDINSRIYFDHKYNVPYWYRRVDCFGKQLNKYGLQNTFIRYSFTSYEDVINSPWCEYYEKECKILKAIKDEPITLKCSKIETYESSTLAAFLHILIFLILCFYLPFIVACMLKIATKALKWIFKGFKEL